MGQTATCPSCGAETRLVPVIRVSLPKPEPSPAESEPVILRSKNVVVTKSRFIVGSKTFSVRGITSVQAVEIPASYSGQIVVIIFGIVMGLAAFANDLRGAGAVLLVIALMLLITGVTLLFTVKPKYQVVITTSSGEITAYESRDDQDISSVVHAVNEAIVALG